MEISKPKRPMLFIAISIVVLAAVSIAALVLTIAFGAPKPIAALDSINAPFKNLDYSALPSAQRYKARDGTGLAYRHYMANPAPNEAFKTVALC